MYPIREDFDAKFLIGASLCEVCFNANQIKMWFDSGCTIVLEGCLVHRIEGQGAIVCDTNMTDVAVTPQTPSVSLFRLIERQVANVRFDQRRFNTTIEFSDGQSIELIGEEPYECYKIKFGDDEILV